MKPVKFNEYITEESEVQKFRLLIITDEPEQAKEFHEVYDNEEEWPDWVWDLDWDHHYDNPGNDDVLSIRVVPKDEE